ncbi:MAG: histidine kinase [Denitrovibrio sp.]|nr:MAG: histidine kinase [Denitrovibrio sp.]
MIRHKLQQKILTVIIVLTIIPLVIITGYSINNLNQVEKYLRANASNALDKQATDSLVLRTRGVAAEVASFLKNVESDLKTLAMLKPDKGYYKSFYQTHKKQIWSVKNGTDYIYDLPLYKEITFVLPTGQEFLRILDGEFTGELRDVSDPKNTTYKNEEYFNKALALKKGEVYVSRVTGFHALKNAKEFNGVIRFSMPVHADDGSLRGVCVLSLDHKHLMEFISHITSAEESFVALPRYAEGNYAFMFDDEGWIIAHPKHWDIRGYDKDGKLVPAYTVDSQAEDIETGRIPYNLKKAGFIHKNYQVAAESVSAKEYGVVDVTNVGGSKKIMAYAPIIYNSGEYEATGIFGGVTIGAQVKQFHKPAIAISDVIKNGVSGFVLRSFFFVLLSVIAVIYVGYRLSRGITKPLISLTDGTKEMAKGNFQALVSVASDDEVGQLASSFNKMAKELEQRRDNLEKTIDKLNQSKDEITKERNFKTVLFENIETGILTLDAENRVTSINEPLKKILGLDGADMGIDILDFFALCPDVVSAVAPHLKDDVKTKWNDYVKVMKDGRELTFRLAFLPLGEDRADGRILTIEDLTERVNMRDQMERMRRLASMGRLSAGLAHEIRNPLTGISIMLDDLHDRLIESPDDQSLIQRSLLEMERLENLINELLDFAVVKESKMQSVNIEKVISDIIILMNKQCERAGIKLVTNFTSLPSVRADDSKLKQAFINLIANAIDSMKGGGRLTISITENESSVVVTVSDTGMGIEQDKLPLIFEPFYTMKKGGAGLGLSITHNIISEHEGAITVDSELGVGTSFIVTLPKS